MSQHRVTVSWERGSSAFTYESYDRTHTWSFSGGVVVRGSSAPEYRGDPGLPNPEEAYAAALSSCHMLTFLAIAARKASFQTSGSVTIVCKSEEKLT